MKKIIVPVDFSEYSENALQTAAFFAKQTNAEIVVVHMLELSNAIISQSESYIQQEMLFYLELSKNKLTGFLDKEYLTGLTVTPIVKHFKIFSELDQLAREEKADLIVMGSKGVSGIKEMFIGSNTEKVIRYAHIPVLVVKEKPITKNIKKALFACDFSDDDVIPYKNAKKLFKSLDASLKVVYVTTPTSNFKSTQEIEKRMKRFFEQTEEDIDKELKKVSVISDYSVEKGVFYQAEKTKADVLVVATHGRKGISHFFEGSVSEDIANHSKLPVMSFKI